MKRNALFLFSVLPLCLLLSLPALALESPRVGVVSPRGGGEKGRAGGGPFPRADGALRRPSSFGPLRDLLPSPRKGTLGGRPELGLRLRGGPPRRDPVRIHAEH